PSLATLNPSARTPLLAVKQTRAFCGATVDPLMLEQLHWIAEQTLAHLSPGRRRELWADARWLGCDPAATMPPVRERLALYRAIANRDATSMHVRAKEMLTTDGRTSPGWRQFLLSAAMLGAFVTGQPDEARGLWARYSDELYPGRRFPPAVVTLANWGR